MISTMRDFKVKCYTKSAKRWLNNDITKINENWTSQVVTPFIPKATKFLDTYDKYILHGRKMNFNECALQATLNSSAVSKLVPPPFEKVLAILREIEVSGRWPKTSEGRGERASLVTEECDATNPIFAPNPLQNFARRS